MDISRNFGALSVLRCFVNWSLLRNKDIFKTLSLLVATRFEFAVWTQIRPDKMSGLIWVQTVQHSDDIPERFLIKVTI